VVPDKPNIKLVLSYIGLLGIGEAIAGAMFLVGVLRGPQWLGIVLVVGGALGVIGYFDLGRTLQAR
jgi:threonine/homoserine efflux transporter RhtA